MLILPYQRGGGGGGGGGAGGAATASTHKRCRMCGNVCHMRMSSCSSCCLPLTEPGAWEPAHMPRPGGGPGAADYGEDDDSSSSESDSGDGGGDAEDSRIGAAQVASKPPTVAAPEATPTATPAATPAASPTATPTATPAAAPTTAATAAITNIPAATTTTTAGGEPVSSTADAAMERRRQERRQRAERQGVSKAAPAPLASEKPGDAAAAAAGGGTSALSKARLARSRRAGTDSITSVDATPTATATAPDTAATTPPPDSPAPDASAPDETAEALRREVIALQHRVTNASLTPSSADATDDASGAPAAAPWWEEWLGADKLAPPAHPRGFDPSLTAAVKALRQGQSKDCPPRHRHAFYSPSRFDLHGNR